MRSINPLKSTVVWDQSNTTTQLKETILKTIFTWWSEEKPLIEETIMKRTNKGCIEQKYN